MLREGSDIRSTLPAVNICVLEKFKCRLDLFDKNVTLQYYFEINILVIMLY